jgi:hypothetical protein
LSSRLLLVASSGDYINLQAMPSIRAIDDPINLVRVSSDPSCSSAEMDTRAYKQTPRPAAPRRGITWNEDVYVQETHHINDFTDEEVFLCWFAKRDYSNMKMEFASTVKMISLGRFNGDTEDHCARGLEYRTREGAHKRKLNKLTALCAVLDEQERQRLSGEWSDETLSQCYIRANAHCRTTSYHMALHDEEVVHGAMLMEPGNEEYDNAEQSGGTTVTTARNKSSPRRSRSTTHSERKSSKQPPGGQEGTTSSRSQDSQKANRIRGFFKRGKDKPDVTMVTMGATR